MAYRNRKDQGPVVASGIVVAETRNRLVVSSGHFIRVSEKHWEKCNMVIWKYKLEIVDLQAINMPVGASVLSVHRQGPHLCMWAMVDPSEPMQGRQFEVIRTGNPITPAQRLFVGTVVVGALVWHVFERLS